MYHTVVSSSSARIIRKGQKLQIVEAVVSALLLVVVIVNYVLYEWTAGSYPDKERKKIHLCSWLPIYCLLTFFCLTHLLHSI